MIKRAYLAFVAFLMVGCSAATPFVISPAPSAVAAPSSEASTRVISKDTVPAPSLGTATPRGTVTPGATAGWKTYTSPSLRLAVDFPPDWSVRAQDSGAVFTSPAGASIYLAPLDARAMNQGGELVQPNTRCSESLNSHRITMRSCRATIGSSLVVELDLQTAGGASDAVISAQDGEVFGVLSALADSARIVP